MSFAQLALVGVAALLGPWLALRRGVRIPVVVGELAVGVLLGTTGLAWLDADDPTLTFLAEIGFALVMFTAGSHVPVRSPALRAGLRRGVLRALAVGALAAVVGPAIAAAFGTGHGLVYAVLLASSSAGLVLPALAGVPLTGRALVEMVPQLAVADAACIVLVPLVVDPADAGRAAVGVVVVAAVAAGLWWVLRRLEAAGVRHRAHEASEQHGLALELRVLLAALFGLAALAGLLHTSVMLAGFALGIAVAGVGEPRRLAKQLFAVTEGCFAPIFFVRLGASLDLRELGTHPAAIGLGLVLGVAAVAVHAALVVTGQPLPVAASTAAQVGVPVAVVTLGAQQQILAPGESAAILLGALVTIGVVAAASGPLVALAGQRPAPQPGSTDGLAGGRGVP